RPLRELHLVPTNACPPSSPCQRPCPTIRVCQIGFRVCQIVPTKKRPPLEGRSTTSCIELWPIGGLQRRRRQARPLGTLTFGGQRCGGRGGCGGWGAAVLVQATRVGLWPQPNA